ncbi:MAG TPA: hypothetical protein GX736_01330 [Mogibacterium sp.]|nr:hypothetical protein [Mogibacterium sp.]
MKKHRIIILSIFILSVFLFCSCGKEVVSWKDASLHDGSTVTVTGYVAGVANTGQAMFINIGNDYPNTDRFTVLVWSENFDNFPIDFLDEINGEKVAVTGEVEMYRGVPEIIISDPKSIDIITD